MTSIPDIKRARTGASFTPLKRAHSLVEDAKFKILTWLSDEELPRLARISRQWYALTQEATQNLYRDFLIRIEKTPNPATDRTVYWDVQAASLEALMKTNVLASAIFENRIEMRLMNSSQKVLAMRSCLRDLKNDEINGFIGEWNVNVSQQGLFFLPREILYWTHLRNLDVSGNPLHEIPEELMEYRFLETIHLQGTKLTAESIASLLRKRAVNGYSLQLECTSGKELEPALKKVALELQEKSLEWRIFLEEDRTSFRLGNLIELSRSFSDRSMHGGVDP